MCALRVFNVDDAFGALLAARPAVRRSHRLQQRADGAPLARARSCARRTSQFIARGHALRSRVQLRQCRRVARRWSAHSMSTTCWPCWPCCWAAVWTCQRAVAALGRAAARQPAGWKYSHARSGRWWWWTMRTRRMHWRRRCEVLRRHAAGRLICVFGCGGDRDRGKRPLMGAVAARGCRPHRAHRRQSAHRGCRGRSSRDIKAGIGAARCRGDARPARRPSRMRCSLAAAGDVVLVAGKGHETYQIVGTESRHFSDQQVVREAAAVARMKRTPEGISRSSAVAASWARIAPTARSAPIRARCAPARSIWRCAGRASMATNSCDAAADAGAVAAVVDRVITSPPLPLIEVADGQAALTRAAAAWRASFTAPVVGVAGSNGKTTVKEMTCLDPCAARRLPRHARQSEQPHRCAADAAAPRG